MDLRDLHHLRYLENLTPSDSTQVSQLPYLAAPGIVQEIKRQMLKPCTQSSTSFVHKDERYDLSSIDFFSPYAMGIA